MQDLAVNSTGSLLQVISNFLANAGSRMFEPKIIIFTFFPHLPDATTSIPMIETDDSGYAAVVLAAGTRRWSGLTQTIFSA